MFPLIFHIPKLPDLKSQKYVAVFGQGVRQKVLSSQKDFLLLLSDLGRVYHLTFSIRYHYNPNLSFDKRLGIYIVVNQPTDNRQLDEDRAAADIEKIVTQGFLSQFYQIELLKDPSQIDHLNWVTHIGETIDRKSVV